jgi:hypothetical protein
MGSGKAELEYRRREPGEESQSHCREQKQGRDDGGRRQRKRGGIQPQKHPRPHERAQTRLLGEIETCVRATETWLNVERPTVQIA